MKQQVTRNTFIDAFIDMEREDQFSRWALNSLYDYFSEIEEECPDVEFELDVIALCCEYVEMTLKEAAEAYDLEEESVLDWLQDETVVIANQYNRVLFQQF